MSDPLVFCGNINIILISGGVSSVGSIVSETLGYRKLGGDCNELLLKLGESCLYIILIAIHDPDKQPGEVGLDTPISRGGFPLITLVQIPRYIALLKNYGSKPTLTKWCINDGETVEEGQTLLIVETTKTSLEIEAIASGMLFILRKTGEKVNIGDTVGVIAKNTESFKAFRDRLLQYPIKGE